MTESSGVVRRILDEDGRSFISFTNHDGYFELPAGDAALRGKAREALDTKREIAFSFNREAKILFIGDKPDGSIGKAPETVAAKPASPK